MVTVSLRTGVASLIRVTVRTRSTVNPSAPGVATQDGSVLGTVVRGVGA